MFSALNKWWFSIRAQDASWGRSPELCRACQWVMQPSPATCWLCDVLHIKSRKKYKIVQFSRSVVSDSLRPHESQHARPHCPSPTPGVHSNSCPSSRWCHPAILSSVIPFSCPQSFPASGSFPMSWFFISGGQSIGASALVSVLPMNIQGWFHLGLIGLISLQSEGLSGVFSSTTQLKSIAQPSLWSNSHICIWQLGKPELWLYGPLSQSNVFAFWYAVQVCHSFSSKGQVS